MYKDFDKQESIEKLNEQIKQVKSEEKICLAFVGQYSAGKSTIIRALTGDKNIKIDSDIATSAVKNYEWGSVLLIDTPGLNTNENNDHDEMAIEAIKRSDLLIYCITSDLFREATKNDFKRLAADHKAKLFLVINKMSKETGEYEVLTENYTDTINKTLAPEFALSDFSHFFIDAADYLEGINNNDRDYIEDSHFDYFIDELNSFIERKGLKAKMVTPIDIMINSVSDTLIDIEDDEHAKEAKTLVRRVCNVVDDKKKTFVRAARDEVQKLAHKFIQKGDDVASQLGDKSFKFDDTDLQNFAEPLQERLCKTIADYFEKYAAETDEEVSRVMSSELAIHFFEQEKNLSLGNKLSGVKGRSETIGKIQQGIGEATTKALPKVTDFVSKFANVSKGQKASIWAVKGSDLHKTVLKVGGKLGHKFKPFEALKISKKIANASKFLGPALTVAGAVAEVGGMLLEKHADKKLEKARSNTKILFIGMSQETEDYYNKQIESAASEFDIITKGLFDEIQRIESTSLSNKEFRTRAAALRKELDDLKHDIEHSA